jgi:microcystin-dependent protein
LNTAVAANIESDVGSVIAMPVNTVPTRYLECNGATISRTTYSSLFGVIGTAYGAGDGSTTFTIPDLRGEFLRGWDNGKGTDSGRSIASAQAAAYQSHTHNIQSAPHNGGYHWPNLPVAGNMGYPSNNIGNNSMVFTFNEGERLIPTGTLHNATSGGAETRPQNIAMMFCIKY